MLIEHEKACLLIVDVQQKLTPLVWHHQAIVDNCQWLMQLAGDLQLPLLVSEQYPQGLGRTVETLQQFANAEDYMTKVHFSCAADSQCLQRINQLERRHVIIAGIETHVCILQTAIGLQLAGKQVYVVADAVGSRHEMDHFQGLQRMRAAGIQIVTKEMVFFECLAQAATPQFKTLSKKYFTQPHIPRSAGFK